METENYNKRYCYLLICSVNMLFQGIIYAWSILNQPFLEEFHWSQGMLSFNFTLTMIFFCLGGILAGRLLRKLNYRQVLILAAIAILIGFFGTSRLQENHIFKLYLCYGVISGLGIGISYNLTITIVSYWFSDKKGTASGILMMCFGISTLLMGTLASRMFDSTLGWRTTFLIFGIGIAAATLLMAVAVHPPKLSGSGNTENTVQSLSTREMLGTKTFWLFFLFGVFLSAVGNALISFAKNYMLYLNSGVNFAVMAVGALSICNGLGRLLCGATFDRLGSDKSMLLGTFFALAATILGLVSMVYRKPVLGFLILCFGGLSYGFPPTLGAPFIAKYYGPRHFQQNFSIANMRIIPTAFVSTLSGFMITKSGSYTLPFVMMLICACAALIIHRRLHKIMAE